MTPKERKRVSMDDFTGRDDSSKAASDRPIAVSQRPIIEAMVQLNVRVPSSLRNGVNRAVHAIEGFLLEEMNEVTVLPKHVVEAALRPALDDLRENGVDSWLAQAVRARVAGSGEEGG